MSYAFPEEVARAYVEKRFPRASKGEREKVIKDWLTKPAQSEGIAQDFERRVGPLAGLRVLDAGSGNGGISLAFADHGAQVEGVDIEEELTAIAKAQGEVRGSTARFTLYEGEKLPFPDQSFDAAVSVSVIEHVTNPVNYLSEILRVLKPGGVFYFAFPNRLTPKETHTGLWGLSYLPAPLARAYARAAGHNPIEDNNLHFYTYFAICRFLRASERGGRKWKIKDEKGGSRSSLKRVVKSALRALGIPHQAFLPHVMLVVEAF
jgi:2-polyprenyl-3-methyl-5-hydroxy-6-metoxy-1,4-benzoquinol methylase